MGLSLVRSGTIVMGTVEAKCRSKYRVNHSIMFIQFCVRVAGKTCDEQLSSECHLCLFLYYFMVQNKYTYELCKTSPI